jgi:probable HAF family extracellular repeat protein
MRWGGLRGFLGGALAAVACAPVFAASGWTLVDVGTLGGPGSYGTAINNSGVVVGCADVPSGGAHAFIFSGDAIHDLEAGSPPSATSSCALAVNDLGVAAGRSSTGEIVIWNRAAVTPLGIQGDVGGIDAANVVVGSYRDGASTVAFRYENGIVTPIAGPTSAASAINAKGQVVGTLNGRAFLYQDGALHDLGTLGGSASSAKGVNDHGEIVGMSSNNFGQPQPFVFDTAMHALPGPSYSSAVAINNSGQVVGSGEGTYGYLLDGDRYTRLDTLPAVVAKGWRHLEPAGINDHGWIVGTATTPSGDLRAFILIPSSSERAPVARFARANR